MTLHDDIWICLSTLTLLAPNPCAAKDGKEPCSHLCLINYNKSFSCACPHLMKLGPDRRTCYGRHEHARLREEPWVRASKQFLLHLLSSLNAAV